MIFPNSRRQPKSKMYRVKNFLYLFFSIQISFLLSCSLEPDIIDADSVGYYYVESVISPAIDVQGVIVGKAIPEKLPENISGARVRISGGGQSLLFTEEQPGIYLDKFKQLNVIPGEKYELQVRTSDEFESTGETTVPGPFQILNPAGNDTIEYEISRVRKWYPDSLHYYEDFGVDSSKVPHVVWQKSEGALVYKVELEEQEERIGVLFKATLDTSIYFPDIFLNSRSWTYQQFNLSFALNIPMKLKIMAYDSLQLIYDTWHRLYWQEDKKKLSAIIEDRMSQGYGSKIPNMTGGKGFFGSFTVAEKNVVVKVKYNGSKDW